ncbi:MAG: hypothetical protein QGI90_11105 [Nitrospinaceae bacterium]|jgi:hypothetical protein|uniref:Uncharacterized protein n=1 Tax=marine metagenome TaxID=408172 RepID=A0A382CAK8_9ZZZZ|nr:hypothetical protein [Nitrospinaceae bacterium]|tara:strand:+ start:150 stop:1406 length:1257 start_codon:yes stop_codon:yes gene_type:complete
MNNKHLLIVSLALIVSVTLNVVGGFFIFAGVQSVEELPLGQALPATDSPLGQAAAHPQQVVTNTVVKQMTWETVEASSYLDYIDNLRRIGCPEKTIRDIILADVNKLYKTKRRAASGQKKFEFWKANAMFGMGMDKDNVETMRELNAERDELLKQLGIESSFESEMSLILNPLQQSLGFLPEQKQVAVMKELQGIQSRIAELSEDGSADIEMVWKAQRETEESIKGMLSEDEYTGYLLRRSNTAHQLRSQIAGFDPSEEEFRTVFKLKRAFDEEYGEIGINLDLLEEQLKAQKTLNEQIRQSLGDERYADYERAQDYQFQQIHSSLKKADLGTGEAIQVYDMQKVAQDAALQLRGNQTLNEAERRERLRQIRNETESAIQQVVGTEGWEKFNRPSNTRWLQSISPNEPKPVPTEQPNP